MGWIASPVFGREGTQHERLEVCIARGSPFLCGGFLVAEGFGRLARLCTTSA